MAACPRAKKGCAIFQLISCLLLSQFLGFWWDFVRFVWVFVRLLLGLVRIGWGLAHFWDFVRFCWDFSRVVWDVGVVWDCSWVCVGCARGCFVFSVGFCWWFCGVLLGFSGVLLFWFWVLLVCVGFCQLRVVVLFGFGLAKDNFTNACAKFDCQNHRDFLGNFEAGVGLNGISLGFHDIVSGCCMLLLFLFRVPWA